MRRHREWSDSTSPYQVVLEENVWPSVCKVKPKCNWAMQQETFPKQRSVLSSEMFKKPFQFWKKKKSQALKRARQSPYKTIRDVLAEPEKSRSFGKICKSDRIKTVLPAIAMKHAPTTHSFIRFIKLKYIITKTMSMRIPLLLASQSPIFWQVWMMVVWMCAWET